MAKKRKSKALWQEYDSYEEFIDAVSGRADEPSEDAVPEVVTEKISLRDFVLEDKVQAFCHDFEPCGEFDAGAVRFGDAELREYFKAYVCGLGDPLTLYIEDLKIYGSFVMVTSLATDEPAVFARRKYKF